MICCCLTDYPKIQQLKMMSNCCLTVSVSQESEHSLEGFLWLSFPWPTIKVRAADISGLDWGQSPTKLIMWLMLGLISSP